MYCFDKRFKSWTDFIFSNISNHDSIIIFQCVFKFRKQGGKFIEKIRDSHVCNMNISKPPGK